MTARDDTEKESEAECRKPITVVRRPPKPKGRGLPERVVAWLKTKL